MSRGLKIALVLVAIVLVSVLLTIDFLRGNALVNDIVMFVLFLFTPVFVDAALFQWSLVAHGLFVGLVYIGLVAHIYYSVVEEPEVLESMKSGYLEEDYIREAIEKAGGNQT